MPGRIAVVLGRGVGVAGILMLIAGCHSGHRSDVLGSLASVTRAKSTTLGPNHLAAAGLATISTACEEQSFENARSGLIASETGLHEEVFSLRSRGTYASLAFSLDDALKLEEVLQKYLKTNQPSSDQRECVQQFEGYLETLSDPMAEQDKLTRDLDATAFKDSAKEAREEVKREKDLEAMAPKK
jgi:hypothetical protein